MRIINSPPFVTSCVTWQEQPEQWTLTVVCKATFSLRPGNAIVAPEPDEINDQDNHWDDDPNKSVYAPSDLVPYKPNPEVLLVGNAFAPRGEPVRSLFARIIVGQLDKSIEVFGQRTISADGSLVDGPRWTQMSLRYERAAGGEGSWNPVGVDSTVADAYGRRTLPNLLPPAFSDVERGASVPARGFGPLAARWAVRREKLGTLGPAFAQGRWTEMPLGMEFDGSYFQSAPQDQFVEELRADETIVLENLHPDIERLVTRLPGIKPRTRVEIEGLPPWELTLVADTLWIDTNRAICTLTFRGQLPLDGRDQPGTIFIGVEYPGEPVRFPDPEPAPRSRMPSVVDLRQTAELDEVELTQTNADALDGDRNTVLPFSPTTSPALPWDPGSKPPAPAPPDPPRPRRAKSSEDQGETSIFQSPAIAGRMPTWLGQGSDPARPMPASAPVASTPASRASALAPPPPVSQMLRGNEVPPSLAMASHRAAAIDNGSGAPIARNPPPVPPPMSRPGSTFTPSIPNAGPPAPSPVRSPSPTLIGGMSPPIPPNPPPPPVSHTGGATFGQQAVLAAAKSQNVLPPLSSSGASAPPPIAAFERDRSRSGQVDARVLATAAFLGAAEASNAAATTLPEEKEEKLSKDKPSTMTSGQTSGRMLVDFLWYDADILPPRLEENPAWKRILEVEPPPEEPKVDDDGYLEPDLSRPQKRPPPPRAEKTPAEKAKDDKSRVSKVVSRASPTMDVENALFSAVNDDGVLEPPLCVVAGEIELPFDEVETLKVLVSAAAPLATADKKLKETVDLANEAMGTPLGNSPEVAANFSIRVRDAWIKANRLLASDYLDVHSRRVLLEQRKYQMRELVGAQWIRAVLHGVSGDRPIPTYLPADLAKKLPLFTKFSARLIVEVLPQQDQNEAHPIALRAYALTRTIVARPRR